MRLRLESRGYGRNESWKHCTPDRDLNIDLPVIDSLVYCDSSSLDHAAIEAEGDPRPPPHPSLPSLPKNFGHETLLLSVNFGKLGTSGRVVPEACVVTQIKTFNFPALNMKLADNELPLGYKLLTAGVSACIADLTTFPLDTAKVRLQHQQYQLLGGGGGGQGVTLITSPNQASISSSATRKASGTAGSCTDGGVIHGVNPCSQVPDYCSPENNS
uniref:Uncharacterized protein n=1 Tax=Timema monikensis TaxID=170555 RepID=A0A7R9EGK6_9NEOP|nr:unnamed protein product [Timema monikensis]